MTRQNLGVAAQGSLSRRRMLRSAGAAGAGWAITAAACGGRQKGPAGSVGPGAAASGAAQPKRGGVLTRAGGAGGSYDTQGRTFDPDIQTQFGAKGYTLFYERLVGYNIGTYALEAELAEKWEQPSQTEYIFHLRPGVKWQTKPALTGRPDGC